MECTYVRCRCGNGTACLSALSLSRSLACKEYTVQYSYSSFAGGEEEEEEVEQIDSYVARALLSSSVRKYCTSTGRYTQKGMLCYTVVDASFGLSRELGVLCCVVSCLLYLHTVAPSCHCQQYWGHTYTHTCTSSAVHNFTRTYGIAGIFGSASSVTLHSLWFPHRSIKLICLLHVTLPSIFLNLMNFHFFLLRPYMYFSCYFSP